LINAVFCGLGHYLAGSPSGIIGFLMTGFLAWLNHFLADVIIFASYAIDWVQA
jgi:thiamine transporter ThiT